jgi:hypothetical protein
MQCEEFEDHLNAVLDERGRPDCDAELQLHIETCAECRHIAACYAVLLDGFYALATPEAPCDLPARVLAASYRPPSRARLATRMAAAMAIAAGFLIALIPLVRVPSRGQPGATVRPVASRLSRATIARTLRSSGSLVAAPVLQSLTALDEKSDVYGQLAKGTGNGLAAAVLYVPGIGGGRGIIDAEESAPNGEPAWAVQMSGGLKPVTDSVTETLNLLLKALPVTELAARS